MIYNTPQDAINAAREMNQVPGYPEAFAVINENHEITVIRTYSLIHWLNYHHLRVFLT